MNMMQLVCFLTVAETLSFARAAEQLHVTQPAVTQQIHALESELNLQLFRRTTRTVELTRDGLVFLGDAKEMVEIYARVKKRAECAVADARESFVIGCHSNNDIFFLAQTLEKMKAQFANLYPVFRVVPFQHLYQRLSEEAVDIVVAFRENELKKAIHYQELMKVPVVGIAKERPDGMQKDELRLCDLKRAPVVVLGPQKCPEAYRKLLHRVLEDRSPTEIYFCDTIEAALTLAQAGYGLAILPDFFEDRNPRLQYFPIAESEPISYGVCYKTLAGHPLRRAFIKLAKETYAPPPLV